MQELIYLSRSKLDRFFGERPRRRQVKTLGLDRFSVGMSDHDDRDKIENRLARVRDHLEQSCFWFADPDAQPGDWVQFEGNLGYSVLSTGKSSLFLMSQTPSSLQGDVALLLHGSPRNLLLKSSETVDVTELDSYIADLVRIANELAELELTFDDLDSSQSSTVEEVTDESQSAAIQIYERIAKRHDGVDFVRGLAKVTLIVTDKPIFIYPDPKADDRVPLYRLVVASPLYVESISRSI